MDTFRQAVGLYRLSIGGVQVYLVRLQDSTGLCCHSIESGKRQYRYSGASVHQPSQWNRCRMGHDERDNERRTLINVRLASGFLVINVVAFQLLRTKTYTRWEYIHHYTSLKQLHIYAIHCRADGHWGIRRQGFRLSRDVPLLWTGQLDSRVEDR